MKRFRAIEVVMLGVLLFAPSAFAQDPNISNGTCYYGPNKKANSRYIPCGNAALGHVSCCESGDTCLSNNACFNGQFYVTYLAGCSDPFYEEDVCPYKDGWASQEWVGLSYCNDNSNLWVGCDDSGRDTPTVTSPEPCSCPTISASTVFTAPSTLENLWILPAFTGQRLACPGDNVDCTLTPSATTTATTTRSSPSSTSTSRPSSSTSHSSSKSLSSTSSSRSSSSKASVNSTSAPTAGAISQTSAPTAIPPASGLSTGAKAGIGIGVALGGCLVLAMLGCSYIRRRKRRQSVYEDTSIRPRSQAITVEKDPSEELNLRSPAWSGKMSKLAGGERNSGSLVSPQSTQGTWSRPTSAEVEGSAPTYQSMGNVRTQALGGVGPAYKPYRPAEAPSVGVHEVSGESGAARAVGRPEGRPGSGVFEIPAAVPGSTLPY